MVVEVHYRGIRVARGKVEGDGDPGFLPFEAPLPVGTRVMVYPDDGPPREAIVTQVVEQDASAKSAPGMKLRWAPAAAVPDVQIPPTPSVEIQAIPEPADSSTKTTVMPAVTEEMIEAADSPRTTLTNMPAVSEPEAEPEPEPDAGGRKRKRRR